MRWILDAIRRCYAGFMGEVGTDPVEEVQALLDKWRETSERAPLIPTVGFFGWRAYDVVAPTGVAQRHILPTDDIDAHQVCEYCPCSPEVRGDIPDHWTHNSWDGRERRHALH